MQPHALNSIDALVWQVDMGCDEAVEATPQMPWKRLEPTQEMPVVTTARHTTAHHELSAPSSTSRNFSAEVGAVMASHQGGGAPTAAPSPSLAAAIAEARAAADAATDLPTLELAVRSFNGCGLKKTANLL